MASAIEWTDETWNPTVGCTKISPGCKFCYAEVMHRRLTAMGQVKYSEPFGCPRPWPDHLKLPLSWPGSRMVFVNSMSDLFHDAFGFEYVAAVFGVMAGCPQHTFQVLTKRPERMLEFFRWLEAQRRGYMHEHRGLLWDCLSQIAGKPVRDLAAGQAFKARDGDAIPQSIGDMCAWRWPLPNVWLGTSVENADYLPRVDSLRQCPAAVRFLSCEPLLGPLDGLDLNGIHWVIAGGESGHKARPMAMDWARQIRDQCIDAEIPFFLKQLGGRRGKRGGSQALLDGRTWNEWPPPPA